VQDIQTTLPLGSVIRERYVIEALLGKGGFGAVYRVRDVRVKGNMYALKEVIAPNREGQTRKEKNRFTFEGEVLKRLDHSALPRVYRVFQDDKQERIYILMDYIEGPNLDMLRQQQPDKRFVLSEVVAMMEPIVDAVNYLHSQQPPIVHRDIKPANIIVASSNEAVLVDFDIAKEYDPEGTTTAVRRCSPGYGAPEQYGQGTSVRTDIYGLGATIYTLLTGLVPPDALQRMTLLGAKGRDPLVPVNQLVRGIPQNVTEAIGKALLLNSADRFLTVEQFWQVFDTYATAKDIPVPPATVSTHLKAAQALVAAGSASGNTTTIPMVTKKQSQTSPSRKRTYLWVMLPLLAFLLGLASVASMWSLFGSQSNVLSVYSDHGRKQTVKVSPWPSPEDTAISTPTTAVAYGKDVSTPSANTLPSTPVPTQVPPTATISSRPTPGPTPMPRPSPTPDPYPTVANGYSGNIDDTTPTPNINTMMYLSSLRQNKGNISGYFAVYAPLRGNGPFTGTVGTNKYIQFIVKSSSVSAPLLFWGFIQANQSIQGQYCSLDQNGHCSASAGAGGYWNVAPASPGS
jgi:eukaryotic-like serine/threonine-protein kinase